jgi:hypothetical protein
LSGFEFAPIGLSPLLPSRSAFGKQHGGLSYYRLGPLFTLVPVHAGKEKAPAGVGWGQQ